MEDLECPRRWRPARMMGWMLIASATVCLGDPTTADGRWQLIYPPVLDGKAGEATAVPMDGSMLVAVMTPGAGAMNPTVRLGNRTVQAQMIGHDPVSRLGFFKVEGGIPVKPADWLNDAGESMGTTLQAVAPGGLIQCRITNWVKQVGGKVLPLALLQVNFDQAVPPPGTPIVDQAGRVAAIVFQKSSSTNIGYAIPAEAVHRVRRDVCNGGRLIRGWLGLSLRAEIPSPRIVRILPNSPAAMVGIKPADVLLSVGSHKITDYADAANAFFYLIPGQTVKVKLLRGADQLEFTLTPTRPIAN